MIELDINPVFDARIMTARRTLADIVTSCEDSVSSNARSIPGASHEEISLCEEIVTTFLGSYLSITEHFKKDELFNLEGRNKHQAVRMYGLYASSKAVLNNLNDETVEKIRGYQLTAPKTTIVYRDICKDSDYLVLEQILGKLSKLRKSNSVSSLKYTYFTFLDRVREMAKNHIKVNCHPDTIRDLNQIHIYKTGLDFHEIPPPQKREFGKDSEKAIAASTNVEQLPGELPIYEPQRVPSLKRVIGNRNAVDILYSAMIRVLKYDSKRKNNPFFPFNDAFIVYGEPGTGKNFTVDALLNRVRDTAQVYGERVDFVKLSHGLRSHYKDRSAQVLEHYVSLENEGDKVYINIIDEADSFFPVDGRGDTQAETQKLLGELKSAINNSDKGNTLYILMTNYAERFEAAFKQRFTPVELKGPTTPEDFARMIAQELGGQRNGMSSDQLYALGEKLYGYKVKFSPQDTVPSIIMNACTTLPITGRDVRKIVAPFVSGDDRIIMENEDMIRRASNDQLVELLPQLQLGVSYNQLEVAIDRHVTDLKKSKQKTTARYNI